MWKARVRKLSWKGLLEDYRMLDKMCGKMGSRRFRRKDHRLLKRLASRAMEAFEPRAYEAGLSSFYEKAHFKKMDDAAGMYLYGRIYIDPDIKSADMSLTMTHEMAHVFGVDDESAAQLYSLDINSRFALEGDGLAEASVYSELSEIAGGVLRLKTRLSKPPKKLRKAVEEVLEQFYDDETDESHSKYSLIPYETLKAAIENGEDTVHVAGHNIGIRNLKRLWEYVEYKEG